MENLELEIRRRLHSIGVPTSHLGYKYLITVIQIVINEPTTMQAFGKEVYPVVATKYLTIPTRVERAIRYAKGKTDYKDLPNKEFVARIAEEISLNQVF